MIISKNDSYTAAGVAPGASLSCSLSLALWSRPLSQGPLEFRLWRKSREKHPPKKLPNPPLPTWETPESAPPHPPYLHLENPLQYL